MTLSELSIRRPVMAWMLMAAIVVFGLISFSKLGISQLPDVDFPNVAVSFSLNGAAPEVMEAQVLDPVEDAIMEIDGIRSVTSSAQQSSASISVEFELNRNIDQAMQEIQAKIRQVQNLLPVDLFPATVRKSNPENQPILWLTVTSDDPATPLIDLMIFARDFVYDRFSTVEGVGDIALGGYVTPSLRVWGDINELNKYNLTALDVLNTMQSENYETPVGVLASSSKEYNVRVIGESKTAEDYGKIMLQNRAFLGPNYRPIPLNKVATVKEGVADVRRIARFNGRQTVGIGIIKQHGSNAVAVADLVKQKVVEVTKELPPHYHLDVRNDNTRFIRQSVDQLIFTLALSALLTSLVCYLFLGSWTSTINVLFSIPTSIIGTFIAFYFFGFTLNTFTLLGLSLAIGIVVDDAIMMLENIVRKREAGEPKKLAALNGANEITFAAMAATIAVVAIFLPVIFMQGVIGRYFFQYGVTVSVAVLLSLLEALTLTPMRCSRYLKVSHENKGLAGFMDRVFNKLASIYSKILVVLLRNRGKTVVIAILFSGLAILVARQLPGELMPKQDQSQVLLRFKMPVGSSIEATSAKMSQAEQYLLRQKEVDGIFSSVGGFGGDAVNQGIAFVMLKDKKQRALSQFEFMNKMRAQFKKLITGCEVVLQDLSLRGFVQSRGFPIEFNVQGPDWQKLTDVTNDIIKKLKDSGVVTDVNTDVQAGMPEVQISPKREALAARGVALGDVTQSLNSLIGGAIIDGEYGYQKNRHRYQVEYRLESSQRDSVPDLNKITVRNNRGELVPLSELVEQTVKPSLMLISRYDRLRAITVYANPAAGQSQKQSLAFVEKTVKSMLPPGYSLRMIGSAQSFKDSIQSLIYAMILGLIVSYMVLASQFNSFIHPVAVLMALPFSFLGAFIGLWIAHQTINMYSLIGFILLMGIVKKNSILLVDYTNQMRKEGNSVADSLLLACPVRLRPILMTSVATVAGALPEALSVGPGSESTIPMAVSLIGGVIASTILTLFVVPCVYSLLASFERRDPLDPENQTKTTISKRESSLALPSTS